MLSALPVQQLPMPGCWALTAAIPMQKFPVSVKLTCPENQCHIMRRLENWKHEDLGNQGYTYSLESNQVNLDGVLSCQNGGTPGVSVEVIPSQGG